MASVATGTVYAEVFGDKHLIHTMESWAARAADPLPAYETMQKYLFQVEEELFESEGASGANGPWNPRIDDRQPPSNPILQATGRLMRSLTTSNEDHHFIMAPSGFAFGTTVPYSELVHGGTEFMEPRRIIDLTLENRQALVEILHLFITRAGLTPVGGGFFSRIRGGKGRFIG